MPRDFDPEHIERGRVEHEAWLAVVKSLRAYGVEINDADDLHSVITWWGEELAQLRMYDPNPQHAINALRERRMKVYG